MDTHTKRLTMTELTNRCLSLDRLNKVKLMRLLQESLDKQEISKEQRFQELLAIATEMFGKGILTDLRIFELVLARRFITYQMVEEGYRREDVSRLLFKHRATVLNMYRMMEEMLRYPHIFQLEMAYWDEFQRKLKEHDKTREI